MGCCVVIGGGQGCRAQAASLKAPQYCLPGQLSWPDPRAPAQGFKMGQNPGFLSFLDSVSVSAQERAWHGPSKAMMFGPSQDPLAPGWARGVYGAGWSDPGAATPQRVLMLPL